MLDVNKQKHIHIMESLISSTIVNYVPLKTRMILLNELNKQDYISSIIPSISLGRRAGHTTALINYLNNVASEKVYVIVSSVANLKNYATDLKISSPIINRIDYNGHVITASRDLRGVDNEIYKSVIFESLLDKKLDGIPYSLLAYHKVIFLGN